MDGYRALSVTLSHAAASCTAVAVDVVDGRLMRGLTAQAATRRCPWLPWISAPGPPRAPRRLRRLVSSFAAHLAPVHQAACFLPLFATVRIKWRWSPCVDELLRRARRTACEARRLGFEWVFVGMVGSVGRDLAAAVLGVPGCSSPLS